MAKRKSKRTDQTEMIQKRRAWLIKLSGAVIIGLSALFGYSHAQPFLAQGEAVKGLLAGVAYGGGALLAILISLFLNRKLKGL